MIAKLKGRIDAIGADWLVIDVNGVGYHVSCSSRTLAALPSPGEFAEVHTEMLVSQDMIRLIGFATVGEREWFRLLQSVQGVGTKVALAILSTLSTSEIGNAVALQALGEGARTAGSLYAYDHWRLGRARVSYGGRYDRLDYLQDRGLLSSSASVEVRAGREREVHLGEGELVGEPTALGRVHRTACIAELGRGAEGAPRHRRTDVEQHALVDRIDDHRTEADTDTVLERVRRLDDFVDRCGLGQRDEHDLAPCRIAEQLEHVVGLGGDRPAARRAAQAGR